jgi:hypothetical protein
MATVLRPPLVFSPQQKRPIAAVDYFSRPITLGINPNAMPDILDDSSPRRRTALSSDVYPNLSVTTLAASAPAFQLPLSALQWGGSAPPLNRQVRVDAYPNTLVLGINPNAAPRQHFDSAPPRKVAVQLDAYPNLSVTTLVPAGSPVPLPLSAEVLDDSSPRAKYAVQVDVYSNLLTNTLAPPALTIPLPLSALRWDEKAPQAKYAVQVDQPLTRPIALNPVPQVQRLDSTTPIRRTPIAAENYPSTLALRVSLSPQILGLDASAPQRRPALRIDTFPNLLGTTLRPLPIALPLGYPVDQSRYHPKYNVQVDIYPNMALLGIPASVSVRVTFEAGADILLFQASADEVQFDAPNERKRFDA